MLELNKIHQGDCLELLRKIPDSSINLIVTDPPYNIGKSFANDNLTKKEFLEWCKKWIIELNRIVKYGGAIYLTLGFQCVAEIKYLFDEIDDLRLKNWIIWYRQDGWKSDNGFGHSHEHILYFIKDNKEHPKLKEFGKYIKEKRNKKKYTTKKCRELIGKRVYKSCGNAGWLWVETGRVPNKEEYLKIKNILDLDNKTDVCDDVWLNPKSEKKRLGHPTQKPVKLFERMITASSDKGDIILDPFIGSGTTAIACRKLGRSFIGIELSEEYCKIANKRLEQNTLFNDNTEEQNV